MSAGGEWPFSVADGMDLLLDALDATRADRDRWKTIADDTCDALGEVESRLRALQSWAEGAKVDVEGLRTRALAAEAEVELWKHRNEDNIRVVEVTEAGLDVAVSRAIEAEERLTYIRGYMMATKENAEDHMKLRDRDPEMCETVIMCMDDLIGEMD